MDFFVCVDSLLQHSIVSQCLYCGEQPLMYLPSLVASASQSAPSQPEFNSLLAAFTHDGMFSSVILSWRLGVVTVKGTGKKKPKGFTMCSRLGNLNCSNGLQEILLASGRCLFLGFALPDVYYKNWMHTEHSVFMISVERGKTQN